MTGTLALILFGGVAVATWLDAQSTREQAIAHCRRLCHEAGLQLLDHTVSLQRISLQRSHGRLGLLRRYGFEVSLDGTDRHACTISLLGRSLLACTIPHAATAAGNPLAEPPT